MKKITFEIPLYYINVTLIQIDDENDIDEIIVECEEMKIGEEEQDVIKDYINRGSTNGGDTYRNLDLCKFLVIFYPFTSEKMRYNVLSHEKRHIEDRILQWASVDDIESAALLAGFLGEKFNEFDLLTRQK